MPPGQEGPMTERPIFEQRSRPGRAPCLEPAGDAGLDDGRAWLAAAASADHRRQPVPQHLLARRLLAAARDARASALSRRSAWRRWRRSIRCVSSACLAPPRSTAASRRPTSLLHSPVLVQTDRPSGKESSFSQALWREHQKRMAAQARQPRRRPAAHARARARSVGAARRGGASARHRLCLLLRADGRQDSGRLQCPRRARCRAAAHRCLGDAAGLYRQAADLPDRRRQPGDVRRSPFREGSDVSLRVTGGSGEETLAYADKAGNARAIDPAGPQAAAAKPRSANPPPHARRCASSPAS